MSEDCVFCKIVNGEIPAKIVYENETVIAFHDNAPQAPVHVLVIPKKHSPSLMHLSDFSVMQAVMEAVPNVAKNCQVEAQGFRLVLNTGSNAGQMVPHIHVHLLGGRSLTWPPG